jgi:ribosomal protein L32
MVVIKDVPARVCDKCGEYSLSDEVSGRVYALAGEAVMRNAELAVLRYTP